MSCSKEGLDHLVVGSESEVMQVSCSLVCVVVVCRSCLVCKCKPFDRTLVATIYLCSTGDLLLEVFWYHEVLVFFSCFKCLVIHVFVLLCCNNVSQNFEDVTQINGF